MARFQSFLNRSAVQVMLLTAGVVCVLLGVWRGEVKTVLMKAIYICLECIGIG